MFGDSLISGYKLKTGESLPSMLHKTLTGQSYDVIVINQGIAGDTTSGGRSRLKATLDQNSPDIIVLALGGNDMLRGIDTKIIRDNLDFMLRILWERKIKTLLVRVSAPPGYDPVYAAELSEAYTDMGKKYNVPVYPFLLEPIFGNPGYMQEDGVHPNAEGVAFIAGYLSNYLISTGWISKKPGT